MTAGRSLEPILVVDDDPDGREMLLEYLRFRGFHVHAASDGAAALALCSTLRPRLILMDLGMAEPDGLETTRRLRTNDGTKHAIIVAVTAHAFVTDRNEAHRAGCDDFISKPFDLATLADTVHRALRLAEPDLMRQAGRTVGETRKIARSLDSAQAVRVQTFTDLMNRTLDTPVGQPLKVEVSHEVDRVGRLAAARKRLNS